MYCPRTELFFHAARLPAKDSSSSLLDHWVCKSVVLALRRMFLSGVILFTLTEPTGFANKIIKL
jgi:hypothetical protein